MSQTPQPFRPKRWLWAIVGTVITSLILMGLYRDTTKFVIGILILTICGAVAFLVISSFWSALQYSKERPRGKPHPLSSRAGMFALAAGFSAFVLCVSTPFLVPLWRLYVAPIVHAIFTHEP